MGGWASADALVVALEEFDKDANVAAFCGRGGASCARWDPLAAREPSVGSNARAWQKPAMARDATGCGLTGMWQRSGRQRRLTQEDTSCNPTACNSKTTSYSSPGRSARLVQPPARPSQPRAARR